MTKSNKTPPLLTVRDIARLDNVSEKTVRRAIASGDLEAIRIGPGKRLLRIHPEAHAAYRRAHRSWA
ncbi:DNA binding domain-containing protein, excisionase family [Lutimaribacter saemankumensis]|uniref:DNA binding domain-containing protein, excisionase family n=2 Tax=Lutimaribacter saemankumensis TaxID=490829 RepID=A0A1G8TI66_9RHOB|nr:DNA binding domain-containing protein, excisionase family [Lutimaribacter saemankumensis]